MRDRRIDLRAARIRGDDALEVRGESHRRLPVAGGTIPCEPPAAQSGEIREQFGRIVRAVARVGRRLRREMVFEIRPWRHYKLQEGVLPACFASL